MHVDAGYGELWWGGKCVMSGPRGNMRDAKIAPCSAQDGVLVKRFVQLCEGAGLSSGTPLQGVVKLSVLD